GGAEGVDPSATGTWAGPGPRSPAGSAPCSPAWSPAASAGRSPQARPPACASASGRQARPPGPAASSPPASPIGLRRRDAQIRQKHSPGRAYFDRKIAEGKTGKEALRCLKRQISDAIYARLIAGTARRTPADANGPGGQSGNGSVSSAAGSHPGRRLFGQA